MAIKIKSNIEKLGWYQVIGGGIGAVTILYTLFTTAQLSGLHIFLYGFILLFFAYSLFCGILCIEHKDNALTYSLINQYMQIFGFAFLGHAFNYNAGLDISVGFDLSNLFQMLFNFSVSNFTFNINGEPGSNEIHFNIVAIGLVYWINKLKNGMATENAIIDIESIGQDEHNVLKM